MCNQVKKSFITLTPDPAIWNFSALAIAPLLRTYKVSVDEARNLVHHDRFLLGMSDPTVAVMKLNR